MLRLMKLEWKKHQLSSCFKSVAICIIAIFAAVSLLRELGGRSTARKSPIGSTNNQWGMDKTPTD